MSMDFPHKDKKRAKRRADKERRRRQELRKITDIWYSNVSSRLPDFEQWREDYARRHADNRKSCSCYMCGNPRKYWKELTLQEKRFSQRERFCD